MDELSKIILACALLVLLILAIIALAVWYSMRARDRGLEPEVEQEILEQNKFLEDIPEGDMVRELVGFDYFGVNERYDHSGM